MNDTPYTNEEIVILGSDAFPQRGIYCPRCKNYIPRFSALDAEAEARLRTHRLAGFKELQEKTGCNSIFAKIWLIHPNGPHEPIVYPPCRYCGKPLFTDKSRQCLQCGWDWHDESRPIRHAVKKDA